MEKPNSYSVAPADPSRKSVLAQGSLLGVVGMALIGLVLVFPKDDLLSRLRRDTAAADQELTIAYLRNLIRTEQKDVGLRLLLAEKLIASREFDAAQTVLNQALQLASDAPQKVRIGQLDTQLAWARFKSTQERLNTLLGKAQPDVLDGRNRSTRADALQLSTQIADLTAQLEAARHVLSMKLVAAIAQFSTSKAGFALMDQANDVGVPQLSKDILQRMATLQLGFDDLLRAARVALSIGQFQWAADFYLAAKNASSGTEKRRELIVMATQTLLASGDPKAAYALAMKEFQSKDAPASGDALWWQIINWALSAGLVKDAAAHLRQVVPSEWRADQLAGQLPAKQLAVALDVALAGGDLPQATRLAQALLLQNPADAALRERYAQVLEWSNKPQEALAQWLALMQRSASERATAQVFRLAPMLFDDDALLAAWISRSQQRSLSAEELVRVVEVYERIGQPDKALAFLERSLAGSGSDAKALRILQASLLERMGQVAKATALLEQIKQDEGQLPRSQAMQLAALHMRRADFRSALAALQSYTPASTGSFDLEYWDFVADLAYEANQQNSAQSALMQLHAHSLRSGKLILRDYQLERLLRTHLEREQYPQVTSIAATIRPLLNAQAQSAPLDMLMTLWLEALASDQNSNSKRADLNQWLAALSPAQLARMDRYPEWLNRRANIYAAIGERQLAAADFRSSLAVMEDVQIRAAYWWMLVDMKDRVSLRRELMRAAPTMRLAPALLEVQGAGWQLLGQWQRALDFYRRQSRDATKAKDPLWLANYADILEQAGDAALALRVRRHAYQLLDQTMQSYSDLQQRRAVQALLLHLRLSENFSSGHEKQQLQKLLGRLLASNDLDPEVRVQAQTLVVAWALGSAHGSGPQGVSNELARRWLWLQQASKLTSDDAPSRLYAQTALALAENDLPTLDRLMEQSARQLQSIDQLSALRQLAQHNPQRRAQAATLAVELAQQQSESPRSDALQQAMEDDLLALASRVRVGSVSRSNDSLRTRGLQAAADIAISPRLRMSLELDRLSHQSNNPAALALANRSDTELRVGAKLLIDGGEISGQITQRQAWGSVAGVLLKLSKQLDKGLELITTLQLRQRSTDSAALSVAGMQDQIAVNLNYQASKALSFQTQAAHTRYATQSGASLGQSNSLGLGAVWYLRRDDPDISLRGNLRRQSSKANGSPDASTAALNPAGTVPAADFFIPQSATTLNLSLGYGLSQSLGNNRTYSRQLRPYGEIGVEQRIGANAATSAYLNLGVRTAVMGRDQLVLGLEIRPSTNTAGPRQTARELRLQYEWIGDR